MADDATVALQKAMFEALSAASAFAEACGGSARVYDAVPEDAVFPYAEIGEDQIIDIPCSFSGADDDASEVHATVHLWSRAGGRVQVKAMAAAATAVLKTTAFDLSAAGARIFACKRDSLRLMRDPDGVTAHGVLVLTYQIQPCSPS